MGRHQSTLDDQKRRFARAIHDGATGAQACVAAGYDGTDNALKVRAHRLLKNSSVVRYLEGLRDGTFDGTECDDPQDATDPAVLAAQLRTIVKTDMSDFFRATDDGGVELALGDALRSGAFRAVKTFQVKADGSVVFSLHDKLRAIKDLRDVERKLTPTDAPVRVPSQAVSIDEARAMRAAKRAAGE